MKKIVGVSLTACLVFGIVIFISQTFRKPIVYDADYPTYTFDTQLYQKADLVIKGKVESSEFRMIDIAMNNETSEQLNPNKKPSDENTVLPYTVYKVRVTKVYQGDAKPGDVIEVKQLGGEHQGQKYVLQDATIPKPQKNYVLFLSTYEGDMPAGLIHPIQGIYELDGEKLIKNAKNGIELKID